MSRSRALVLLLTGLALVSSTPAHAAGVVVQSFATMAAFQASPFYAYVTTTLAGGAAGNCATTVDAVAQGDAAVPSNSAGAPLNATVTPEIVSAAAGEPTVFGGSVDTTDYQKQYVSIGNETAGSPVPLLTMEIPPVVAAGAGGFQGYEIAIIDIGDNLGPGTGSRNSERTRFRVESSLGGGPVQVGTITNTGSDYINVVLLDVDGLIGLSGPIDIVHVIDSSGHNPPQKGSLDVDGVIRLAVAPVPTLPSTWGALKASYR